MNYKHNRKYLIDVIICFRFDFEFENFYGTHMQSSRSFTVFMLILSLCSAADFVINHLYANSVANVNDHLIGKLSNVMMRLVNISVRFNSKFH